MLFNSYEFIFVFLPLTIIGYFGLLHAGRERWARSWLLLSSLFFYSYWKPVYLPLIVGSVIFNYLVGTSFGDTRLARRVGNTRLLVLGVATNLGLLGWFKYAGFFVDNLNRLFGSDLPSMHMELPLAISFFTFQQIAYLVDSYRGLARDYDPLHYSVFVTFFPQLIAGPIVHHSEVVPQFASPRTWILSHRNLCRGVTIFSIGLFKKTIVADSLAVWANAGFDESANLHLIAAWASSLAYTLQLYFDFSGYADMAIGGALLFNIKIPANFESPYKSLDLQEFWRRWHITLGRFLREYVYIPLGGNRVTERALTRNLMITFLLGGLWHGAGWTFIFWGFLHGVGQVIHRQWRRRGHSLRRFPAWLLTFVFVHVGWVFFRALNWSDAVKVLRGLVGLDGVMLPRRLADRLSFLTDWGVEFGPVYEVVNGGSSTTYTLLAALLIAILAPNSRQLMERFRPNFFWLVFVLVTLYWGVSGLVKVNEFLYFNF